MQQKKEENKLKSGVQINNFNFFKLSESFAEKQKYKIF